MQLSFIWEAFAIPYSCDGDTNPSSYQRVNKYIQVGAVDVDGWLSDCLWKRIGKFGSSVATWMVSYLDFIPLSNLFSFYSLPCPFIIYSRRSYHPESDGCRLNVKEN